MRRTKNPIPGDTSEPQSLACLLVQYLLWMATHHYAASTVDLRRNIMSRFIRWCLDRGVTRPSEVTDTMIGRYQRHLYCFRKPDGQPLSISSQAHSLTALRGWFAWMQRQQLIEHNPAANVQLPRSEKRLPRHALSVREVESVLAQPDVTKPLGVRDRAMLETLYSTGLRRSELLSLHLTDLDRERLLVLVRCGKGKKDRFVPIGERALAWLDKYLAEVRPQLARGDSTPVLFLTSTPRRMSPNHFSALVRHYFEAAGLNYAGACHLFRHAVATLMLENGADIRFLQSLLGHDSLRTTQIYAHVSIAKLSEVHRKTHPARLSRRSGEGTPEHDVPDSNRHDDDDGDATAVLV